MSLQTPSRSRGVLKKVTQILAARGRTESVLDTFANALFEDGGCADLSPFTPDHVADIATDAFEFARNRQRGRSNIRVVNQQIKQANENRAYTLIEIGNDDMPFLVESVLAESGIEVHFLLHPVLWVARNTKGRLEQVLTKGAMIAEHGVRESFIHIHVDRIAADSAVAELEKRLIKILDDVRTVVLDWPSMRARLEGAISAYKSTPPPVSVAGLSETIEFMEWLAQDHFTLLGMREFKFEGSKSKAALTRLKGSGLGVLRDPNACVLRRGTELVTMSPEVRELLMQPAPLIVTKANVKAHVHRRTHMVYIGVKQFDEKGNVSGELRIVGLFTSAAYTRSARTIPFLRRKMDLVMAMTGFDASTHSGRALVNVLESYPRDELFQIDVDTLAATAQGVLQLATSFEGRISAFYPAYPEGTLARVHFIIGHDGDRIPDVDTGELEHAVAAIARGCTDSLKLALEAAHGPADGLALLEAYKGSFSPAYQDYYPPKGVIRNIAKVKALDGGAGLGIDLTPRLMTHDQDRDGVPDLHLKLFHPNEPIALSDRLPVLENMGFRAINERSYEIVERTSGVGRRIWLHDIVLTGDDDEDIDLGGIGKLIEDGFLAVWNGEAENDGYNRLIRHVGVGWREVSILRAIGKYLQQAGIPFSQDYLAATLTRHPHIAAHLPELFQVRFDPALSAEPAARDKQAAKLIGKIDAALDNVPVLDEDRIIRQFVNVITAGLRTNYYQIDDAGHPQAAIAIKLRSAMVEALPKPHPHAEIFVYSPRVEGVHLRGGPIAHGGLRWSDRLQDFRTEVLGLVKAQQVKNAVIVPVGAKGGFVPKHLPRSGSREEMIAEGIACYKIFIQSLLDVTDNLVNDQIVAPRDVVRHDGDDPYLVVATDKGTATFSDIANGISLERGFWLGDAFASGGSGGYDHKKMGITARGGWEAVKRHFREMDHDIQNEPFRVIGVGDMSGDVFGNGMLLSKKIKLVAAFDHRDIFIDPDPAKSHAELNRMFTLTRSTCRDYKTDLISTGGGVFSHQEKSIRLSKRLRALTGLESDRATPNELIRAMLRAEADLLWFGGIGTYIRASSEIDADAGDRANDTLRITASEVVGEGANLGLTQLARIEYAASVNCSDVEVNIKIALGNAIKNKALAPGDRDTLLAKMTDQVSELVLHNNYQQTLCLSLAASRGDQDLDYQQRLMRELESRDLLDRAVEDLPDDIVLVERRTEGGTLTRPELAVLSAYAKITLFYDILHTNVTDDPYFGRELISYFPAQTRQRFGLAITDHRLRREIIATMLANNILNRGGSTMIQRLMDETGADIAEIVTAFALTSDSYDIEGLLDEIDALDNKVANAVQTALYLEVQTLIRRQTVWFLRHGADGSGLEPAVARYRDGIGDLDKALAKVLPQTVNAGIKQRADELENAGVPGKLAKRMANLPVLRRGVDIVLVASATRKPVEDVAGVFFRLGDELGTDELLERAEATEALGYYDRLALNRVIENITAAQWRLTTEALSLSGKKKPVERWLESHAQPMDRARRCFRTCRFRNADAFQTVSGERLYARSG